MVKFEKRVSSNSVLDFYKKGSFMEKTDKLFRELVFLIRTLRGEKGCPWDRKQTIETLQHYLHQEFQELMEALDKKSPEKTQEEMGDLIFLLLFCAEIARDKGDFSIGDVLENVKKKMVGRHPHVFENRHVNDIAEIRENWKEIKAKEKVIASQRTLQEKLPQHLPALLQAYWINRKVIKVSNDGRKVALSLMGTITKTIKELTEHLTPEDRGVTKQCLGDLFFDLVGLSVSLKINPEEALKESLQRYLHDSLRNGR